MMCVKLIILVKNRVKHLKMDDYSGYQWLIFANKRLHELVLRHEQNNHTKQSTNGRKSTILLVVPNQIKSNIPSSGSRTAVQRNICPLRWQYTSYIQDNFYLDMYRYGIDTMKVT